MRKLKLMIELIYWLSYLAIIGIGFLAWVLTYLGI